MTTVKTILVISLLSFFFISNAAFAGPKNVSDIDGIVRLSASQITQLLKGKKVKTEEMGGNYQGEIRILACHADGKASLYKEKNDYGSGGVWSVSERGGGLFIAKYETWNKGKELPRAVYKTLDGTVYFVSTRSGKLKSRITKISDL